MTLAQFGHRLVPAFLGFLLLICALPRVHGHPVLLASVAGAAVVLGLWHFLLARSGRPREIEPNLKPNHYVQLFCHASIYAYWGWFWPQVYQSMPLILAQVAFGYLFEMALAWTRGKAWRSGFGPVPIVFSLNLFLWFKDDWFYWQFPMLALAFLQKDLLHWTRDGVRRHIFNPSAFALSVAALILIPFDLSYTTWGEEIATTLAQPPGIYIWIFLLGLIVQYRFPILTMTMSAVAGCVLFQWLDFRETGNYIFVDTTVPIAVFLGMTFLFTDPMTSPRSNLGKILFGFLYGAAVVWEYKWLQGMGRPAIGDSPAVNVTYFDKLIQVPFLNLMVPVFDWIGRRLSLERLKFNLELKPVRYGMLALWLPVFWFAFLPGFTEHPGGKIGFWEDKCNLNPTQDDPFCRNFALFLKDHCERTGANAPIACDQLATLYEDGVGVPENNLLAARLHEKACEGGRPVACTNLGVMFLEGRGGPADLETAKKLFRRACEAEDPDGCQNLGAVLGQTARGDRAAIGEAMKLLEKAHGMYRKRCEEGDQDACARLTEIGGPAGGAPPAGP